MYVSNGSCQTAMHRFLSGHAVYHVSEQLRTLAVRLREGRREAHSGWRKVMLRHPVWWLRYVFGHSISGVNSLNMGSVLLQASEYSSRY